MTLPLGAASSARYEVSRKDSWLTFEARATLHAVRGKTTEIDGYIEAAWDANGVLAIDPAPKMHVDFLVERLHSGNSLQDREITRVIDSTRFPRIAADLRELRPEQGPGSYAANGDITLAGRARPYAGHLTFLPAGESVTIDGELVLDIRDFGIKPPSLLIMKVDPIVKVRLHLVARTA